MSTVAPTPPSVTKTRFYQQISDFPKEYLRINRYYERLAKHGHPDELTQEIIRDLNSQIMKIQHRPEMRYIDPDTNAYGFVTSRINQIIRENRNIRLYQATLQYCSEKGKEMAIIAPHIAEYRAVNILQKRLDNSSNRRRRGKTKPEAEAIDKPYFDVLDQILVYGAHMERSKRLHRSIREETCRDHFVAHLSSLTSSLSIKGEVFNHNGRTDILVTGPGDETILIAECKIWHGSAHFTRAVGQLLNNYVSCRDGRTALVLFNKSVKNFAYVIEKAHQVLESHPLYLKSFGNRKDTAYSFLFRHPGDTSKTIKLELILFNFIQ